CRPPVPTGSTGRVAHTPPARQGVAADRCPWKFARRSPLIAPMAQADIEPGDSALAARLTNALRGEVLFDAASRGRYSTDASIYQIEPLGVVVPRDREDVVAALQMPGGGG